jgi:Family of unknown function (DUF6804)
MYLKITISVSFAALAVALFMTSNADYRMFLQFLVCTSAALIVWNAVRAETQHLWASVFCGVAILFNPILPVALPGRVFFFLDLLCMALFLVYYRRYPGKPQLSMALTSVTDRRLGPRADPKGGTKYAI